MPTMDLKNQNSSNLDPTIPSSISTTIPTARDYYNAPSTDSFYHSIWGGEDIHIGTYTSPSDTVQNASERTVSRMAALANPITPTTRVLDIGAGYGGAARYLARTYGCHVTCLNLSEVQNERNREKTRGQGLDRLVEVVDGTFEELPFGNGSFDLVWCQDCLIHSTDRGGVVREIGRVLAEKGGAIVLSDYMAMEGAEVEKIEAIKQRLALSLDLATRRWYREAFGSQRLEEKEYIEGTEHLIMHCDKVLAGLDDVEILDRGLSAKFIENAKFGMLNWIKGGEQGQIEWGIFHFCR